MVMMQLVVVVVAMVVAVIGVVVTVRGLDSENFHFDCVVFVVAAAVVVEMLMLL